MENRVSNQIKNSPSIKSEDIKNLMEILEIEKLSGILEQFYSATGLSNFIVDLKGNILHGVGWKNICTEFHRKHKTSSERCLKSDTILANQLKKKEKYSIYTCQNGMVDAATPIIIDGVHVANLFIGQFFLETPDKDFFIEQAEELGFDKENYMKALEECRVYDKESVLRYLDFFSELINMVGESALMTINQNRQLAEISAKEKQAAKLILDKEQAEAANATLSKAWKYNRSLIEANLGFMVTLGPNGIITDVNNATENATGLPREKLIGTFFSEYFPEPGKAQAGYQQAFKEGKVINYELNLKHTSGTSIPVLFNATVYKDDEGQINGVLAVGRDISAIKKYEDELIDFKNNLELIVQQQKSESIIANEELAYQTGEKEDRAAELEIADKELTFQTDEKADRAAELKIAEKELAFQKGEKADRAAELLIANKELRFQNSERADRAAELEIADKELAFQIKEKADRAAELLIANKELRFQNSEKEKRAAELIIANKELESLTYSISHDLKAPLRHIVGYASLLAKKYFSWLPDEGRRYLENITSATKNMGELIDGLLHFSRTGRIAMKKSLLNMNEIVEAYIQPIREEDLEHRIVFEIDTMPQAFGDPEMIKSVWSNLIDNAVKYSRKKELANITIGAEQTENETIYHIIDNGVGFDMSHASKIFAVFQRLHSREDYEGTGIGLATVHRVITRHGGRIWAESKIDEGAAFYFTLMKRK